MLSTLEHREKFVAIGECGLDYDRFEFAGKAEQMMCFAPHFDLAEKHKLPMYLHSRSTGDDFYHIVKENRHKFSTGVVHSFTGTIAEMNQLLDLGLYIGINGCSMKTEELCEMVKAVPLERMMVETDCPYCDIRNTHAGSKFVKTKFPKVDLKKFKAEDNFTICKDRNEPCTIV
jgi:TatD DNase family protein